MQQRELIQSALRKMGPEKVTNALAAFEHYEANRMSGDRCFLGQSFGGAGSLIREVRARYGWHVVYTFEWAGEVLGLTVEEIRAIIAAFDDFLTGVHHDELEAMAHRYLAQHTLQAATASAAAEVPDGLVLV